MIEEEKIIIFLAHPSLWQRAGKQTLCLGLSCKVQQKNIGADPFLLAQRNVSGEVKFSKPIILHQSGATVEIIRVSSAELLSNLNKIVMKIRDSFKRSGFMSKCLN